MSGKAVSDHCRLERLPVLTALLIKKKAIRMTESAFSTAKKEMYAAVNMETYRVWIEAGLLIIY